MDTTRPAVGVGAVIFKGDRVLMIQRGKPPGVGRWSIPGGHQEWGETAAEGAAREVLEETGVICRLRAFVDYIDGMGPMDGDRVSYHYTLLDFWGEWVSGEPVAADDALAATWLSREQIAALDLWPETRDVIFKAYEMRGQTV